MEICPLSTDDYPVNTGPSTLVIACEVELSVKIPVMQLQWVHFISSLSIRAYSEMNYPQGYPFC